MSKSKAVVLTLTLKCANDAATDYMLFLYVLIFALVNVGVLMFVMS